MTIFQYGATTLTLSCDPVKGVNEETERLQAIGRYSDGALVVYDKSTTQRNGHELPFRKLTAADLLGLQAFMTEVQGSRYPFTWTDTFGVVRTVRFASWQIDSSQVGPDRYTATVSLIEREAL